MRNVILQIDVTLDGFIGAANGESNFVTGDPMMNQDALELLDTVDTIMLGRVAYEDFVQYWPFADTEGTSVLSQIARRINTATKLVCSKTLDSATWGKWDNARVVKNVAEEIPRLKAQTGKNMLLYAGAEIVHAFMQHGLIDEYRIRVHPVVLGGGKPLFDNTPQTLKLIDTKTYGNEAVMLRYLPAGK